MRALNLSLLLLVSVTYYLAFFLNDYLFSFLAHTDHVNWIYLPSGIVLGYVLVLEEIGALGIFLASLLINFQLHPSESFGSDMVTSLISAGTPLIARQVSVYWFKIDENLTDLNFQKITESCIVFALLSSACHQLWFHFEKLDEIFFEDFLAMFVGDVVGSLIVLFLGSYAIKLCRHYKVGKF